MIRKLLVSILILIATTVYAQVPPHPPGTICTTQSFWCWNQRAEKGEVGKTCYCAAGIGLVKGVFLDGPESETGYLERLRALNIYLPKSDR